MLGLVSLLAGFGLVTLVIGGALFLPALIVEFYVGGDKLGLATLPSTLLSLGMTALAAGSVALMLPLYWVLHDISKDPVVGAALLALILGWIGYKLLGLYFRRTS